MRDKISIVVPVYKVEKYIRQCVDSLINQTYQNIEIILIDDGSPDACGEICDEYSLMDERVKVIHKENGGLPAARNEGIKIATGEWIAFVDSDDWCDLNYYHNVINELQGKTVDVFCAGGHIREYENKSEKFLLYDEPFDYCEVENFEMLKAKVLAPRCFMRRKKTYSFGAPWDKIYRTEFLKTMETCFDVGSKAWEDLLFNYQVLGKVTRVAGGICPGYHYRIINNSITHTYNSHRLEINDHFVEELLKEGIITDIQVEAFQIRCINLIGNSLCCYLLNPQNKDSKETKKQKINKLTSKDYYAKAINSKITKNYSVGQIILKLALRLNNYYILQLLTKLK